MGEVEFKIFNWCDLPEEPKCSTLDAFLDSCTDLLALHGPPPLPKCICPWLICFECPVSEKFRLEATLPSMPSCVRDAAKAPPAQGAPLAVPSLLKIHWVPLGQVLPSAVATRGVDSSIMCFRS